MYDVNLVLCVLSANPINKEQLVLSTSEDKIIFPMFKPSQCSNLLKEAIDNVSTCFNNYNKSYEDISKMFLVNINSENMNRLLNCSDNTINILYGITIPQYKTNDSYFWKNFDFYDTSIPNELCIIGETIKYGF